MSTEFKQITDSSGLIELLTTYATTAMARPDFQEPTFRCGKCRDTGFIIHEDSKRRVYGTRCECLVAEIVAHKTGKGKGPKFIASTEPQEELPF